jgi:hypothetical protein
VLTVVESFRLVEPWSEADGWRDCRSDPMELGPNRLGQSR